MKKVIVILILGSFINSYSAENSNPSHNGNIPLPSQAIMLQRKHQKKLDEIKQEFSPTFLRNENLNVRNGRLSPGNSPSQSGSITPTGSSGKLLNNDRTK